MSQINLTGAAKFVSLLFLICNFLLPQIEYTQSFYKSLNANQLLIDDIVSDYLRENFVSIPPQPYGEVPFNFGCTGRQTDLEFRIMVTDEAENLKPKLELNLLAEAASSQAYTVDQLNDELLKTYNADEGYSILLKQLRPEFSKQFKMCRLYFVQKSGIGYFSMFFLTNSFEADIRKAINKLQYLLYFENNATKYAGLGIMIKPDPDNNIVIEKIIKNYGAYTAGLLPLDVITGINDTDIQGMSMTAIAAKLKGPAGTSVKLNIMRGGHPQSVTVMRKKIDLTGEIIYLGPGDMPEDLVNEDQNFKADICKFLDGILHSNTDKNEYKGKYIGKDFMGAESWVAKVDFPGAVSGRFLRVLSFTESNTLEYIISEDLPADKAVIRYNALTQSIDSCIGGMYINDEKTSEKQNKKVTYFEHALRGTSDDMNKMPVIKVYLTNGNSVGLNFLFF